MMAHTKDQSEKEQQQILVCQLYSARTISPATTAEAQARR
jgi:hypothetical protein